MKPIVQAAAALALLCPFVSAQEIKLLPSDGSTEDWFGSSVAISGNTAIVGAKKHNLSGTVERGSAYLFDATTGAELAMLLASDGAVFDWFGNSVAISGNTAIVGASEDDDNGYNSGSAYLFDISNPAAPIETKLLPSDGANDDYFGYSVAISGTTAIVGARLDDDNGIDSGSAYLFDTTTGTQTFKLSATSTRGGSYDWIGHSVAIDGTIAIIGAPNDDDQGSNCGSAYLFDTTTGTQTFKLLPSDGAADDSFGWSVAISGNTAIVGARKDDDNGGDSGSAYLFDTTTGAQIAKLLVSDGEWNDHFGFSVAISGTTAIVGALYDDDQGMDSGSAYLFDSTTGTQLVKLLSSDGASNDLFGCTVAISSDRVVVGAQWDADNGIESGSAYLYSNGDCNINGVWDWQDISSGSSSDCNSNGIPDYCDITYFASQDCNFDLIPDECQLTGNDCNSDLIPDECQLTGNDCNSDRIPDDCQLTDNDCNSDLIPDECQLDGNDFNSNGIPDECDCIARWFCSTSPNSVGPGMLINYEGDLSVSVNDLTLTASGGPPNQPGLFYYGPGQTNGGNGTPFGNGLRCVSWGGVGVFRIQDPTSGNAYAFMDSAGNTTKPFDMTYGSMGSGPGQIQPGSTWNIQFWYRDPTAGPPGLNFNLSDAMELTFCP